MLSIRFSTLSTKGLAALAESCIQLTEQNANKEVAKSPLFEKIKTSYNEYNNNLIKPSYSGMGDFIRQQDIVQDRYYAASRRLLLGFAAFEGSRRAKQAQKLLKIYDRHGSPLNLTYAQESILLQKLFETLNLPENKATIAELGIEEEMELFEQAHKDFYRVYLSQIDANSELRQQPTATSLRKDLESALRDFFAFISAMRKLSDWQDIYNDLNEVLKKIV